MEVEICWQLAPWGPTILRGGTGTTEIMQNSGAINDSNKQRSTNNDKPCWRLKLQQGENGHTL